MRLVVDSFPSAGPALHVGLYANETFTDAACPVGGPHRHDFHELFWTSDGIGRHLLDGRRSTTVANTVMLIPRGQVHHFERAEGLSGAYVRFGAELLDASARPGRLSAGREVSTVQVPPEDTAPLDSVIRALAAETRRPLDAQSAPIHRHLLLTVLAWIERWHSADARAPAAEARLCRRFDALLERDFARRHDVGHYAAELRVSTGALWRAVSQVTGRPPRALITDRVMLEAARLLRFTDLSVGEISASVGVQDRLYFSRAFKRQYGLSPLAYRERLEGGSEAP
ncbi:helix-turn-helix transcriptional regulator [Streptomyces herbicida]|uniref:helix-turn-helix transcriptional regulator n=1 Tax=Streptomyces herbicida TaxID=3065675 RepID=UPI0029315CB3|nr:AraC family transcriptional regulator [Streptomyces sp. NEAU-HV9]